jgi:ABC-2 type transport system permease protein
LLRFFKKTLAFLVRDLRIEVSYKAGFFMQGLGILFTVVTFYFLSKLIDSASTPALSKFSGGYFPFVLTGIAMTNFLSVATRSYADRLREAQVTGTLEAMLMTPTPVGQIVSLSAMYDFVFASMRVVLYLLLAATLFGMDVSHANWGWAALFLLLSIAAFSSMGILSASFIMVFKRGDPLATVYGALSFLFSGVYYPVDVLPGWLRTISNFLPLTWALKGMRGALLGGGGDSGLPYCAAVLVLFSLVLWPLSLTAFSLAIRKARRDGSLGKF